MQNAHELGIVIIDAEANGAFEWRRDKTDPDAAR
jgi:hypothetical protein